MPSNPRNPDTLTHFDAHGKAHMVDVGDKPASARKAVAEGRICMTADTLKLIAQGAHAKGDVLAVARIAGIAGAKRTAELVPLCHPLALTHLAVEFKIDAAQNSVHCIATAQTRERTGVEMEALCAVQCALLTIYDMCKAVDRAMVITQVRLMEKSGGQSGDWRRADK